MIGTSGNHQYEARLERTSDWASEKRLDTLELDHVALCIAAGYKTTLGGGRLAGMLVEIGSTAAIADSTALELVTELNAEWKDYTLADTEYFEHVPFAHEVAVQVRLAMFAHCRDVACAGAVWPHYHHFWASSRDFERPAGLPFLYTVY